MVCPACGQQPLSKIRFLSGYKLLSLNCQKCGEELRAGKVVSFSVFFTYAFSFGFLMIFAILFSKGKQIETTDLVNMLSILFAFCVIFEAIIWYFGSYEKVNPS